MTEPAAPLHLDLVGRIVDALIPGDANFPSASAVGVVGKLFERAHTAIGPNYIATLLSRLALPADALDDAVAAALTAYEAGAPEAFAMLLTIVYMSYYESLPVKAAIRGMGPAYHDTPQPEGYAMSPFDAANPLENPAHRRGHFVPTAEVQRVAWEPLGDLAKRVG